MFHHTLPQLYALSTQEGKLVLRLEIVAVYRVWEYPRDGPEAFYLPQYR